MRKYNTADRLRELMTERGWKQVDVINNSKPFQEKIRGQARKKCSFSIRKRNTSTRSKEARSFSFDF